ncbi:MAG: hypothetical protein ACOYOJ_21960, partial [Alsobacter sp.]
MIRALVILALIAGAGWAVTQPGGVIALLFAAAVLYLAYKRLSLLAYTVTFLVLLAAYTAFGEPAGVWKGFLWLMLAGLAFLNLRPIRKALISRPFMKAYRRMLPAMSQTEREALEAG